MANKCRILENARNNAIRWHKTSLIALSANEDAMAGILNYKFNTGKLKALSFGDIYLLGMKELYGDLPNP